MALLAATARAQYDSPQFPGLVSSVGTLGAVPDDSGPRGWTGSGAIQITAP